MICLHAVCGIEEKQYPVSLPCSPEDQSVNKITGRNYNLKQVLGSDGNGCGVPS